MEVFSSIYLVYLAVSRHLTELSNEMARVHEIVTLAELNHLSPSILSPTLLLQIVAEARSKLPRGLDFVQYRESDIRSLYWFASARVIRRGRVSLSW
jgi:hypothetical protein